MLAHPFVTGSRISLGRTAWLAGLLLLLAGLPRSADSSSDDREEAGLPSGICHGAFCGPDQQDIWSRFSAGEGLDVEAAPGMYAGVCFVRGDRMDPRRLHHVGFLIDDVFDHPHVLLRFSFYADRQPFLDLDVEQARFRLEGPLLELDFRERYAYADVQQAAFFERYWFRRDASSDRILLVSYFGYRTTIICDAAPTA